MTVFAAFAKEACNLARSGMWGVDQVELEVSKWMYSTVLFADTDIGIQGERFRHFLTPNGTDIKREILAVLKQEPQWRQYEEDLLEVSEIQSAAEKIGTEKNIPIRGHHSEIRGWMRTKEISSVKEAARQLHVSESTLKSIMTSKGDIRHSQETVEAILRKIRVFKSGE